MKLCWDGQFDTVAEIDISNTAKARSTAQRHIEPIDTPKPTIGHCTTLQRDEIQLPQPEHRHKHPQPGKHNRTLIQPHLWEQTPQPRTMTLRTFFLINPLFIPPTYFYLHISLLWCCGFPYLQKRCSFPLCFSHLKKKIILRFFFFFTFFSFGDVSDFVFWYIQLLFFIILYRL